MFQNWNHTGFKSSVQLVTFANLILSLILPWIDTIRKWLLYLTAFTSVGLVALYIQNPDPFTWTQIALTRSFRVVRVAIDIVWDYYTTLKPFQNKSNKELENDDGYLELKSRLHKRSAEKILDVFNKNGGIYIKLGQHIAALQYLLPVEYVETMKVLQDRCIPSSIPEIKEMILKDTGKRMEDLFESFDPIPLGVASLAQVHKATLKNGHKVVAVKLQHPSLDAHTPIDIELCVQIIRLIKKMFPKFEFDWLAEEMQTSLPQELDFVREAENAMRVKKNFEREVWVKIPDVYWSSRRILVMEFIEGGKVDNLQYLTSQNIKPVDVSNAMGRVFNQMIFFDGFVHCDPHPGNVFVRPTSRKPRWYINWIPFLNYFLNENPYNFELVLLDHGLYRHLSDTLRLTYAKLWSSVIRFNEKEIEENCYAIFHPSNETQNEDEEGVIHHHRLFASMLTGRPWDVLEAPGSITTQKTKDEKDEVQTRLGTGRFLVAIAAILAKLPREVLLLLKTNDLLRSLDEDLGITKPDSEFSQGSGMLRRVSLMGWFCAVAIRDETMKRIFEEEGFRWERVLVSASASASGASSLLVTALASIVALTTALPTTSLNHADTPESHLLASRQNPAGIPTTLVVSNYSLWVPAFLTPDSRIDPSITDVWHPFALKQTQLDLVGANNSTDNPTMITIQLLCNKAENALVISFSDEFQNYIIPANSSQVYYLITDANQFKDRTLRVDQLGRDPINTATCDLFIQLNRPDRDNASNDSRPVFFGRDVNPGNYAGKLIPAPTGTTSTGFVTTPKIPSKAYRQYSFFDNFPYTTNCYRPQLLTPVFDSNSKRRKMPPGSAVKISLEFAPFNTPATVPFLINKYTDTFRAEEYLKTSTVTLEKQGVLSMSGFQRSLDDDGSKLVWDVYLDVAGYDWHTDAICILPDALFGGNGDYNVTFQGMKAADVFGGTVIERQAGEVTVFEIGNLSPASGPRPFTLKTSNGDGLKLIASTNCACVNTPPTKRPNAQGIANVEDDFVAFSRTPSFDFYSPFSNLTFNNGSVTYAPNWFPKTLSGTNEARLVFIPPADDTCTCTATVKDSQGGKDLILPGRSNPTTCEMDVSPYTLENHNDNFVQSGVVTNGVEDAFRVVLPPTPKDRSDYVTIKVTFTAKYADGSKAPLYLSITPNPSSSSSSSSSSGGGAPLEIRESTKQFSVTTSPTDSKVLCARTTIKSFDFTPVFYTVSFTRTDIRILQVKDSVYLPGFLKPEDPVVAAQIPTGSSGYTLLSQLNLEFPQTTERRYFTAQLICDKPGQPLRLSNGYTTSERRDYVIPTNNTEVLFMTDFASRNFVFVGRRNGKVNEASCDLYIQYSDLTVPTNPTGIPYFLNRQVAPLSIFGKPLPANLSTLDSNGYYTTPKTTTPLTPVSPSRRSFSVDSFSTDCYRPTFSNSTENLLPINTVLKVTIEYEPTTPPPSSSTTTTTTEEGPFTVYVARQPMQMDGEAPVVNGIGTILPASSSSGSSNRGAVLEVYMRIGWFEKVYDAVCVRPGKGVKGEGYEISFKGLGVGEVPEGRPVTKAT
ncbi:hypothetical protein HDV05_002338 [Chytridiales sp. JEL 0842]|nr:hypothetical protein HDV05_002338 [Chytridiales sp. JEL 0842]